MLHSDLPSIQLDDNSKSSGDVRDGKTLFKHELSMSCFQTDKLQKLSG